MTTRESAPRTNFAHLEAHDEQLVRLGMLAERYFADDPNTALLKLRQLAELLAQLVATRVGLYTSREEAQYDLLRRLQDQSILPREIAQLFGEIRRAGNAANHAIVGDHRTALAVLKITWQLGIWFHRTFANAGFKSGPFIPPTAPKVEHYRPKKRGKRSPRGQVSDGYWWLAFEWSNYRLCGKVGNAKKGDFFTTTTARLNLNQGRIKKARQRVWARCWQLIEDCRALAQQMNQAAGPADRERPNQKKEELRRMVRPEAEFSAIAKDCLVKSNIGWVRTLAAG